MKRIKNNAGGRSRLPRTALVLLVWLSGSVVAAWVAIAALLPPVKAKATWLWDPSLIGTDDSRSQMIQFANQRKIVRIYLQIDTDVSESAYRSFMKSASENNIEVYALDGAPEWALPEHRERIASLVGWVKTYNGSAAADERFAGIQLDVEPYLLPQWNEDRAAITRSWLAALSHFHDEAKKDSALATSAALPFWLDGMTLDGGVSLAEAIIGKLDEVALMSYRDEADAAAGLVQEELAWGDRYGKKVWIGLETNPAPDSPHISFHGKGKAELERQMARIDKLVKAHSSYAGIVVHDYTGWRALKN